MIRRELLVFIALGGLTGCFTTVKSNMTLTAAQIASLEAFDYTDWSGLLKDHVDGRGRVDYGALKDQRRRLDRFVALVGAVGPKTRPDLFPTNAHKLAYYINAYNAFTMFNVINRLPGLKTVIDDKTSFFYFTEFPIDGGQISLYKLENDLIRPQFKEPRIHFALNCASIGCPQLPATPFLPKTLESQLAAETQKFLRETRNVAVENGGVVLSHIFKWYKDDFPPNPVAWIQNQAKEIELPQNAQVTFRPYDWSLNTQ